MQEIAGELQSLSLSQIYDVVASLREMALRNPDQVRHMLMNNPPLVFALLQAEVMLNMVNPAVLQQFVPQAGSSAGGPRSLPGPAVPAGPGGGGHPMYMAQQQQYPGPPPQGMKPGPMGGHMAQQQYPAPPGRLPPQASMGLPNPPILSLPPDKLMPMFELMSKFRMMSPQDFQMLPEPHQRYIHSILQDVKLLVQLAPQQVDMYPARERDIIIHFQRILR